METRIPWTELEIVVTSICNRKCPECCYRIPTHETLAPKHYDWAMFERAAEAFRGLDTLYVSGGEATLHPDLPKIAREFRGMFRATKMILVTNGFRLLDHKDSIGYFDRVWLTRFPEPYTRDAASWLMEHCHHKLLSAAADHVPFLVPGSGKRCERYGIMACANDKAWPCCVGPGLTLADSVPVAPGCRDRLPTLGVPCKTCCFS